MKIVAVEGMETAGAITYWRLSGELSAFILAEAWEDAGLDGKMLPAPVGPEKILRRTMMQLTSQHRLCRPLPSGGYAIVDEASTDSGDLAYAVGLKARILESGDVAVEPSNHPDAPNVAEQYEQNKRMMTTGDVSGWLTHLIKKTNAVSLRESGGVYFVPRPQLDTWRTISKVLRAVSDHLIYEIPALKTDEAVEAILAAVQAEAEREAASLEEELAKGVLTARALKGRTSKTEQILAKIQSYEQLLGRSMTEMRTRVEDLKASITVAIFQADSAEEVAA